MTQDEIYRLVNTMIQHARNGHKSESEKFDFKRQWSNLKSEEKINQFLRHTCAIANTFGPDGFILIGYDEDKNQLHNSVFTDSGLRDLSDLTNLVASRVDRLFSFNVIPMEFEGSNLNIIHIPPSIDKPHLILNYQTFPKDGPPKSEKHRVFVRKNTDSLIATRNDIELMYYDRKNIIPEYEMHAYYNPNAFYLNYAHLADGSHMLCLYTFENTGRRPIAINNIGLNIGLDEDRTYRFYCPSYTNASLIIATGEIKNVKLELFPMERHFSSGPDRQYFINSPGQLKYSHLELGLVNGNKLIAKTSIYK
jgi:hypothetical protein